ncbi:MAG: hypothetical protein ACRC62_14050 [Microcoleus sp.]
MTTKTMTVGGQRINVNQFSDYYFEFIRSLFDADGQLLMDLGRHSTIIEMTAEVIAPTLPKKLYRHVGDRYYWNGTVSEFGELLNGLYLAFWEYALDAAKAEGNQSTINQAKAQIEMVKPPDTTKSAQRTPEEWAELKQIEHDDLLNLTNQEPLLTLS